MVQRETHNHFVAHSFIHFFSFFFAVTWCCRVEAEAGADIGKVEADAVDFDADLSGQRAGDVAQLAPQVFHAAERRKNPVAGHGENNINIFFVVILCELFGQS